MGECVGVRAPSSRGRVSLGWKNSESGEAATIVGVAGRVHSVAVLDAPGVGLEVWGTPSDGSGMSPRGSGQLKPH